MRYPSLRLLLLGVATAVAAFAANTAIEPAPRDEAWLKKHQAMLTQTKAGGFDLVFLGDSITEQWGTKGKAVWDREYAPLKAGNYGIGGDRSQHILWRIQQGELDGLKPRALVLLIGTNNTGKERDNVTVRNTPDETVAGVRAVVAAVRAKLPDTKILLLGLFPRSDGPDGVPVRAEIAAINREIAKLSDGRHVFYHDIGGRFLDAQGRIPDEIMPDHLHLTEAGYVIWADAIRAPLAELLK